VTFPPIVHRLDVADVGVFGGSGFYDLLDGPVEHFSLHTPYGPPSDAIAVGRKGQQRVAFLPRHGSHHTIPPHAINYRANVWAMAHLGVKRLVSPTAAGSLQPHVMPGDFVVCDQFVDRTTGRLQTYYDGPRTVHISTADPYCPDLRALAIQASRELGITVHEHGTVVVIQGPRFSTRAESRWFRAQGWEVVNMTQYPEVALARELELCYTTIALITDYDAGVEDRPEIGAVEVQDVLQVLRDNNERVRRVIELLLPRIPADRTCPCASALQYAVVS
jgi:5'-methylthioadenosine phosphorylase